MGGDSLAPPPGLAARGLRMWEQSLGAWQLTPAHLVLLEEACRVADRLEILDRLIRRFLEGPSAFADDSDEDSGGSDGVTGLFAEARAQQTALKGLLAEMRQGQRLAGGNAGAAGKGGGSTAGGSSVTDLAAVIAAKRQAKG
jgi:hypothetical protein